MGNEFTTIIHNLVLDNTMPAKDLAKAIGKPYSTLLREVNPYDTGAKLGAESFFQIMYITGNYAPMEYMADKLGLELKQIENHVPHVIPGSFSRGSSLPYHQMPKDNSSEIHAMPSLATQAEICPTCGKTHFA